MKLIHRRHAATVLLVSAFVAGSTLIPSSASAATKPKTTTKTKTTTKPKAGAAKATAGTAKYCAAAQKWLDFENATLATGPYDDAWVATTRKLLYDMSDKAPTTPKFYGVQFAGFAVGLVVSRETLAGTKNISEQSEIDALGLTAEDLQSVASTNARDIVGEYTLKTCKIDVLQPFKDLAAGFN